MVAQHSLVPTAISERSPISFYIKCAAQALMGHCLLMIFMGSFTPPVSALLTLSVQCLPYQHYQSHWQKRFKFFYNVRMVQKDCINLHFVFESLTLFHCLLVMFIGLLAPPHLDTQVPDLATASKALCEWTAMEYHCVKYPMFRRQTFLKQVVIW